jgi:hypothetical protein
MLKPILFSYTVYYDYFQIVGIDRLCLMASSYHLVQYLVIDSPVITYVVALGCRGDAYTLLDIRIHDITVVADPNK